VKRRKRLVWLVPPLLGAALLIFLFNVSRSGTRVEGCPEGCAVTGEGQGDVLRVLSMNVLHGFPRFEHLEQRLDLVADAIRRQNVDIALLQEVPWNRQLGSGAAYLARRTGFNYLYLRANGNRHAIFFEEGEAILSRFPLKDVSFVELQPQAGFFEHRVVLHATGITPWGDIDLFGTHLTTGKQEINQAQVVSLQAFVQGTGSATALVGGDFNARDNSPQIEMLAQEWQDVYRTANPGDPGLTCCIDDLGGGPQEPLEKRIDYLFLVRRGVPGVEVESARRLLDELVQTAGGWLWASDHVGVLGQLAEK
jgi:endonuclease/exonuclease/phosphatase family metal-dependent hydrolase